MSAWYMKTECANKWLEMLIYQIIISLKVVKN